MPKKKSRSKEGVSNVSAVSGEAQDPKFLRGQTDAASKKNSVWICLLLLAINIVVFGRTLGWQFVNFDDNYYVYENGMVRAGLTLQSVKWAFTTFEMGHWHPLTWISYMADFELYGLNPAGYHFTNLLLHSADALLVFLLLRHMTSAVWPSAAVAAFFAIHPLHVEPAIWISCRKDLLSALFGLSALYAYVYYTKKTYSKQRYILVFVLLFLGLMSKSMVMTIPLVMLLLDYWPLRRYRHALEEGKESFKSCAVRMIREKAPLFALAAVFVFIAFQSQTTGKRISAIDQGEVEETIEIPRSLSGISVPIDSYGSYIGKTFWPEDLSVFYIFDKTPPLWSTATKAILLISATVFAILQARKYPHLLVGWFWYIVMLLPVIRFLRSDRYTYLPLIGLFIVIVWSVSNAFSESRSMKIPVRVLGVISILALIIVSWRQAGVWRDAVTLSSHAVSTADNNITMRNNLGAALFKQGRLEEASKEFSEAIRLNPDFAGAHNNLGMTLLKQGKLDEARRHFEEAVRAMPNYARAYGNLGQTLLKQENLESAAQNYAEAVRLDPNFAVAYYKLGYIFFKQERFEDAEVHFLKAVGLKPNLAEAHYFLGLSFYNRGKLNKAEEYLSKAVLLKPDYDEARKILEKLRSMKNSLPPFQNRQPTLP